MQAKDWLMFRVLANKFHDGNSSDFLQNMPQELSQAVLSQNILSKDAELLLSQPQTLIEKVHYSWLLDAFRKIPKSLQPSVLISIPEAHAKGLAKLCNMPLKKIEIAPAFKRFLTNTLYTQFEKKEILPYEFLPETSFSGLVSLSKSELVTIIDYLGIYDLSEELRHIVEKNLLNSIYAAVPLKKQQFLKSCLNQKEKLVTPRLELENWNKDPKELEKMLHKRGMIRLSRALSGTHPDFLWHIVHILDKGRGQIVASYYKEEETAAVSSALASQVMNVINFLKK